jgi:hypothetical protein
MNRNIGIYHLLVIVPNVHHIKILPIKLWIRLISLVISSLISFGDPEFTLFGCVTIDRGAGGVPLGTRDVDFFTSHEALVLDYESAVTRALPSHHVAPPIATTRRATTSIMTTQVDTASIAHAPDFMASRSYYNLGAHFLWIGDRTSSM